MVDNLILLDYIEDNLDVKKLVRVVKMRGSQHSSDLRELKVQNNKLEISQSRNLFVPTYMGGDHEH